MKVKCSWRGQVLTSRRRRVDKQLFAPASTTPADAWLLERVTSVADEDDGDLDDDQLELMVGHLAASQPCVELC
jgi:hypothetical protein